MDSEKRGARQRALMRLEGAAVHVQACVARGCAGRGLAMEARKRRDLEREREKVNWAASAIQTRWGGRRGGVGVVTRVFMGRALREGFIICFGQITSEPREE